MINKVDIQLNLIKFTEKHQVQVQPMSNIIKEGLLKIDKISKIKIK